MVICAAFGCKSFSGRNKEGTRDKVSFFRFPKDKKLQKVWSTKMRRASSTSSYKAYSPNKHSRLCSLHFEEDQFTHDLTFLEKIGFNESFLRKLKSDAVPTIFSTTAIRDDHQQRKTKRQHTHRSRRVKKRSKNQIICNAKTPSHNLTEKTSCLESEQSTVFNVNGSPTATPMHQADHDGDLPVNLETLASVACNTPSLPVYNYVL